MLADGPPTPTSGALLDAARLFAPRWCELRGCVVRHETYDPGRFEARWRETGGDRRTIELEFNRARLALEVSDPDGEILHEVAVLLVTAWSATLRAAFPDRDFDVELADHGDGPEVTAASHTVRPSVELIADSR